MISVIINGICGQMGRAVYAAIQAQSGAFSTVAGIDPRDCASAFACPVYRTLDDVNERLDTNLTAELSDSLGGFIFSTLGRVPQQGDTLQVQDWTFTVKEIHGQRITKICARRNTPQPQHVKEEVL